MHSHLESDSLQPHTPYPTTFSTPRKRDRLTAEPALASSPTLEDAGATPSQQSRIGHGKASYGQSGNDVVGLGFESGVLGDSELDGNESLLTDEEPGQDENAASVTSSHEAHNTVAGAIEHSEATHDADNYSELSKRADLILASAKRKLDLLEGNIKGARHSLMEPPLSLQLSRSNSVAASTPPKSSPLRATAEEDHGAIRGPRINFGRPRTARLATPDKARAHTRVLSETTLPSARNGGVKEDLGLDRVQKRNSRAGHSLEKLKDNGMRSSDPESDANNRRPADWTRDSGYISPSYMSRPGHRASANTQVLRSEADELRDRLSLIQERVRNESDKRRSIQGNLLETDDREKAVIERVQELEQSLEKQEEVIDELENAQRNVKEGARAEWQNVFETEETSNSDPYSERDRFDVDAEINFQDGHEDELDFETAHEDRLDAFDYETYILSSAMGDHNYENLVQRRYSKSSSRSSTSSGRPHGRRQGYEAAYSYDSDEEYPDDIRGDTSHQDDKISSAEDEMKDGRDAHSVTESDRSGNYEDGLKHRLQVPWPKPPPSNASRQPSTVFSISETPSPAPQCGSMGHRPASIVYSALLGPESSSGLPDLKEQDQSLVYSVAEALRTVCLKLQKNTLGDEQEAEDWRTRLEEARQVLLGEEPINAL